MTEWVALVPTTEHGRAIETTVEPNASLTDMLVDAFVRDSAMFPITQNGNDDR